MGNRPGHGQAMLALRNTLSLEARKRSVRDAMAYAASLGVTMHLDQGALQSTRNPGLSDRGSQGRRAAEGLTLVTLCRPSTRRAGGRPV